MIQREAGDRRVEVHRRPGCHAHEGGDEHAALDDDVVAPFGFREALEEPLEEVALHQGLSGDARFLRPGVYARLELHRVLGPHSSTSR